MSGPAGGSGRIAALRPTACDCEAAAARIRATGYPRAEEEKMLRLLESFSTGQE